MDRVQFLAEARNLSLLRSIQTGSGAHPAPYHIVTDLINALLGKSLVNTFP
jgi:hypothetical protein